MLRKEARDALKRFIESLVALLIIPFMYVGDKLVTKAGLDYASLIHTGFVITLLIYAVYAGATVFQSERKDRAFEYLFSLPLTRRKIILAKVLPRLGLLLLLGGAATIVVGRGLPAELGITLLLLFFSSLFLSIGVFSFVINLFGVGLMYLIYFQGVLVLALLLPKLGIDLTGRHSSLIVQLVSAAVLLVPFGIAFWLTFKKMDVRPPKLQMRTYYSIILPTLFVLVSLIVLLSRRLVPAGLQGR
jgi:ABC-type transport system involved in multi-copper enzyme maturation permease subunit